MDLEFKTDFEQTRQRWGAFWKNELTGRPIVSMIVPKKNTEPLSSPPYMSGAEGDLDQVIDQILGWAQTHEFLGEAIPFYRVEFGPDHFSMLLGAERRINPDSANTCWVEPFVEDWSSARIEFRPELKWWRRTVEFIERLKSRCCGRLLIAPPTLVGGLDALAAIRGVNRLMADLVMEPELVKDALGKIDQAYGKVVLMLSELLDCSRLGGINRHGLYCMGPMNVPQCDCSCMISAEMFREFAIPSLKRELALLAAGEYHLDGPGSLRHLETLCELDDLDVIQWVPGSGSPTSQDWTDLYVRINKLGKGVLIERCTPECAMRLSNVLGSRKNVFHVQVDSRKEAESFLSSLESSYA